MQKLVTGCADRFPMVDRHGRQLMVGDTIRFQHCVGRYGQTAISTAKVTEEHYQYGAIEGANFHFDHRARVLRGSHTHNDYEHGHDTWVEIVSRQEV